MRAILPTIATLAILCAACSDTTSSPTSDSKREASAYLVGGINYPLVAITPAVSALKPLDSVDVQAKLTDINGSWLGKSISWTSSDPTILKVTTRNAGLVSG